MSKLDLSCFFEEFEKDPKLEEVAKFVVKFQNSSISEIERSFGIGFNRSTRILDQLEVCGIVGPLNIDKSRSVLCKSDSELIEIVNSKKNVKIFNRDNILSEFTVDDFGNLLLVDYKFITELVVQNQKRIVEIDHTYVLKFQRIVSYLSSSTKFLQGIFQSLKIINNEQELIQTSQLLKNQLSIYESLIFHSVTMITSLLDSDFMTFFEIHEIFDKNGVFNSNWENEISQKLSDIEEGVQNLIFSVSEIGSSIVESLDELNYLTNSNITNLTERIDKHLGNINVSLNINNLLTGIQTYQMYRINHNTKGLN